MLRWTYRHRRHLNHLSLLLMAGGLVALAVGFRLGGLAIFVGVPLLLLGLYNGTGDYEGAAAPDPNSSAVGQYGSGIDGH